jgi:hypothetical protein
VTDQQGKVTVTWESGASAEGPVGLETFTAFDPQGGTCFERSQDGNVIVITAGSEVWRVEPGGAGSTTVTCPGGATETHGPGEFPSTAPGIDPDVFIGCRIGGMCTQDTDCEAGQVCCDHQCVTGERCPGTCEVDEHCGPGNRCCDGWCTSLPACNMPCTTDAQCDDGVYCNGAEVCNSNRCQAASPVDCDDSVSCTFDACNEQAGRCENQPDDQLCGPEQMCDPDDGCVAVIRCSGDADCDDGDACTTGTCTGGICAFEPVDGCCHQDADCDDGAVCNGIEQCSNNACAAGVPPDCSDDHDCTADSCDAARNECVHEPDSGLCLQDQVCDPEQGCIDPGDCEDDDYEDNDSQATARRLVIPEDDGLPLMLQMCPSDDDWFIFDAPELADVTVTLIWFFEGYDLEVNLFGGVGFEFTRETYEIDNTKVVIYEASEIPHNAEFIVQVLGVGSVVQPYFLTIEVSPY